MLIGVDFKSPKICTRFQLVLLLPLGAFVKVGEEDCPWPAKSPYFFAGLFLGRKTIQVVLPPQPAAPNRTASPWLGKNRSTHGLWITMMYSEVHIHILKKLL